MGMMFKFPYKESPYLVVPAVTAKNCCRAENAAKPRARMRQSPTPHPSEPLHLGMWLSFNCFGDRLHKFTNKTSSLSATMSTGIFL